MKENCNTWDLVKPPPNADIMGSKWIYDIKWDGEGNRLKDKVRVVEKGYTQQLGVDYNETWAAVTRLESVCMTATIAAKHDLKLWRLDFVGAYLNSLTKEDIYMKQAEGFVKPGFEDYTAKLQYFALPHIVWPDFQQTLLYLAIGTIFVKFSSQSPVDFRQTLDKLLLPVRVWVRVWVRVGFRLGLGLGLGG